MVDVIEQVPITISIIIVVSNAEINREKDCVTSFS